jgi:hypothetical protein
MPRLASAARTWLLLQASMFRVTIPIFKSEPSMSVYSAMMDATDCALKVSAKRNSEQSIFEVKLLSLKKRVHGKKGRVEKSAFLSSILFLLSASGLSGC